MPLHYSRQSPTGKQQESRVHGSPLRVAPVVIFIVIGVLVVQAFTFQFSTYFQGEIYNQVTGSIVFDEQQQQQQQQQRRQQSILENVASSLTLASTNLSTAAQGLGETTTTTTTRLGSSLEFERGLKMNPSSTVELWHRQESLQDAHLFRPSFWPNSEKEPTKSSTSYSQIKVPLISANSNLSMGQSRTFQPPTCRAEPSTTLTFSNLSSTEVFVNVSEFMILDEIPVYIKPRDGSAAIGPYALCRFMDYQYAHQPPHFAQQLFRCWSFWRTHSNKTPALLTTKDSHWNLAMDQEFNRGIVSVMQKRGVRVFHPSDVGMSLRRQLSVDQLQERKNSVSARVVGPMLQQADTHFQTSSLEDMQALRQGVLSTLGFNDTQVPPSSCHNPRNFPRIGILNRRNLGKIRNYREIVNDLTNHFNITDYDIPVIKQWEYAPFPKMVAMPATMDILISPHGVHEAAIAFMPQCGGVLELIPEQYYFPRFYGSLAATVGVEHSFLYMTSNPLDTTLNVHRRNALSYCPSLKRIREGVSQLVERWRSCCDAMSTTTVASIPPQ